MFIESLQSLMIYKIFFSNNTAFIYIFSCKLNIKIIGQATVAFMSYTNLANILEPRFNTFTDTTKTIMSVVVSATLPKTTFTEPVNFTLKHITVSS